MQYNIVLILPCTTEATVYERGRRLLVGATPVQLSVVVGRWSTFQQSNTCTFEQTRVSELPPAQVVATVDTNSHVICLSKVDLHFELCALLNCQSDLIDSVQ